MFFKKIIIFCSLVFLISCSSLSQKRQEGFDALQEHFNLIEPTEKKDFHITIRLKNVKVHIVSDRKFFKFKKFQKQEFGAVGYATSGNEIWVFGKIKEKNGKKVVIVNQAILGHEFNHLLNFKNPKIVNPDKLDKFCP